MRAGSGTLGVASDGEMVAGPKKKRKKGERIGEMGFASKGGDQLNKILL